MFVAIVLLPHAVTAQDAPYDPGAWAEIARDYVDDKGLVDYARLQKDRARLDAFLSSVANLSPSAIAAMPDAERIAFWVNVYNAITVQRIIDHYPIAPSGDSAAGTPLPLNSIRQIDGVWNKLTTRVLGQDMTLDHIEHDILRKEFREPRVHMELVCASNGCPSLRTDAATGPLLDKQLDEQSRRFLASRLRFQIDRAAGVVRLSPIFKWYGKDFVGVYNTSGEIKGHSPEECAVLDFASRYVPEADAHYLRTESYRVEFLEYDWSLNERK